MERTTQGEFCWLDLSATNLDVQTDFYEGLFGWTHVDLPTDVGPIYRQFMLDSRIVAGAAQQSPDQQGMPSMWNLYICADDVDDIAARAAELGGTVFMPTMQVMDQGRMVGIADPTGSMIMFWEPGVHKGASVFGETGSFGWADLSTSDPGEASRFYSRLLGWQIDEIEEAGMLYWQVTVAGTPEGGIMPMPATLPPDVPPHWLVYFMVGDATDTLERARSLGGTAEMEPTEAGNVTFAVVSDPMGATFAIMEAMEG
jgi:predicted enzyme related to lactoylglutathione lyase